MCLLNSQSGPIPLKLGWISSKDNPKYLTHFLFPGLIRSPNLKPFMAIKKNQNPGGRLELCAS